ncbi:MAG: 2-isopropylmalate synthase [Candidatus Omnitrophota bacterium]
MKDKERLIIFDTTLRDGEQCPGASLETPQKLEIARQLERLGVDVIEAGFPIASPGDFEAVKMIAQQVRKPVICGLARTIEKDIERAAAAVRPARRSRIHVFIATSPIHMKYKLKKAEGEIVRIAKESVRYARKFVDDVEFSPEDAARSERQFLFRVIETAIAAGATTINVPDTVGYTTPAEFGDLIRSIRDHVPNIHKAVISIHCHNDLGLAVANSLAAVMNGARQVECTLNGIGERAGNASLEEIVMGVRTRKDIYPVYTEIDTRQIMKTSRLVSALTGLLVQPNKAIVGANAFRHESGIHQDGILKRRLTYEIMDPKDVGVGDSKLVLGKHSGRHAFSERLKKLGFQLSQTQLEHAFEEFKKLADKKKEVFDGDLTAIIEGEITRVPETYELMYVHTSSGTGTVPTATLRLKSRGKILQDASSGDGPVDACYKTIDRITGVKGKLLDYSLRAVTGGKDAQGEVVLRAKFGNQVITGRGTSTDIIEASAKAYLSAINRYLYEPTLKRLSRSQEKGLV